MAVPPRGGRATPAPDRLGGALACGFRLGTTGYPRVRLRNATPEPDTPLSSEPDRTAVPFAPAGLAHSDRGTPQMASMALNDLGPMLTASEVAEMLHLHVNTVKRLGDRGELPFYRVCKRGDRRFRLEDVMAFLARNR
jgi:excisionase family DNA binding protein